MRRFQPSADGKLGTDAQAAGLKVVAVRLVKSGNCSTKLLPLVSAAFRFRRLFKNVKRAFKPIGRPQV